MIHLGIDEGEGIFIWSIDDQGAIVGGAHPPLDFFFQFGYTNTDDEYWGGWFFQVRFLFYTFKFASDCLKR